MHDTIITDMPKKTKKQKIKNTNVHQSAVESTNPTFSFTRTSTTQHTKEDKELFAYVKKDLLKTIILAVVCIGTLIALSYILK